VIRNNIFIIIISTMLVMITILIVLLKKYTIDILKDIIIQIAKC